MTAAKKISNLTLGSDIEFFLKNIETGEIVSAEKFAKGTKDQPFNFDKSHKFWMTSLDNVAYEGNIPPIRTKDELYNNVQKLINYINSTLPAELTTVMIPAHDFDRKKWLNTPNAQRFGCEATYNVWTQDVNPAPDVNTNTRSTGMHIHAVWDNMDIETVEEWIKAMDLFAGISSVLIEPANKRRDLYGKAGEFRVTNNCDRAEYRVLSGYFAGSKELIDFAYDATDRAINWVNEGKKIDLNSTLAKDIQTAINKSDKALATKIVEAYQIPVLEVAA